MTDKKEIQCEYCTVRSNENKCKALKIEFHNCLNILEQKKCPIYKLKQQLQEKEQECEELKREIAFGNNGKLSDKIRAIVFKDLNEENLKYNQALDEIEGILNNGTADTQNNNAKWLQQHYLARFCEIRNIINKAKGGVNGNT